jgi:hypothetical protein
VEIIVWFPYPKDQMFAVTMMQVALADLDTIIRARQSPPIQVRQIRMEKRRTEICDAVGQFF